MTTEGTQGSVDAPDPSPAPAEPQSQPKAVSPTVPEGMQLVSREELATLKRQSDSYRGQAPLAQRLVESGIKTREELDAVLNPFLSAREQGIDLGGILGSLRKPQGDTQDAEAAPLTRSDLLATLDERDAKARHQSGLAEETQRIRSIVGELAGESGTENDRLIALAVVKELADGFDSTYESGPLKGSLRPLSNTEIATIQTKAADVLKAVRGQHLKNVADNASTARAVSPSQVGMGATDGNGDGKPSIEDQARAIMDRINGGVPMSSA